MDRHTLGRTEQTRPAHQPLYRLPDESGRPDQTALGHCTRHRALRRQTDHRHKKRSLPFQPGNGHLRTSFQGYLDDAMDLKVFRFLSKPIDENRFFKSMDVALNLYKQSTEKIILDYFDECHNIFTIDILYLTIENRKTKLVTKTQEFISNKKFDYWKNRLKSYGYFAQSHYSYIINLKNVTDFNKNEITLSFNSKKTTVPISRSFYASFKKAFYEYMGGTI